ncbi:MAG: helix-turn-helix domain-containing protein, partial [Nanoarchaeota archaeon]
NPDIFLKKSNSIEEINSLIKNRESEELEFKSTLRKNLYTGDSDKKIENSVLKTIVAFMNTNGGTLIIGVNDNGEILGLEKDNFVNNDKLNLHLINLIKSRIGKNYISLIQFDIININKKDVLVIRCAKSKKPVFLNEEEKEKFYIRVGPGSIELSGSSLIDYIKKKFD